MAFACMISISVFGQGQIKLHQASRDSLIGDIDESGSFEIWEPNNAASSGLSYQDAFFNALEDFVYTIGINSVIEVNESITKNSEGGIILNETETISNSKGEIILNETEGLVVKFSVQDTDQATEGLGGVEFFTLITELTIHYNKSIVASREQYVIQSDFKNLFEEEMYKHKENIEIFPYAKHKQSVYDVYENLGVYYGIQFYSDCDFSCVLELFHQSGIDFDFVYRGGQYYVWLLNE